MDDESSKESAGTNDFTSESSPDGGRGAWLRDDGGSRDGGGPSGGAGSGGGEHRWDPPGESRPGGLEAAGGGEIVLEEGLERLKREARRMAAEDAERGLPAENGGGPAPGEMSLRERCRALFERWLLTERRRIRETLAEREEQVSELLGRAGLLLDRFERLKNELIRLKARRASRRSEEDEREDREGGRDRGLPTKIYIPAIGFLGLVEFFANAPVFSTLLPRDPLTERQIQVLSETATGWMAGVERVLAQLVLRPDAALLAAGVVAFLCVLAHFFGHSLRELVMQKDGRSRGGSLDVRSPMENMVPMVLTGLGLALVLGVLFEARVILGEVGERRYQDDMEAVQELRREAGWLRTDGELLEANELRDRADDMEEAATRLREYAASMSRMSFPILLLNVTLVLAAITAAYFHRRDGSERHFYESPYEDDRRELIQAAETTASEVADVLHRAVRPLREMENMTEDGLRRDPEGVVRRLESVIVLYRSENARARELEGPAVSDGEVDLDIELDGDVLALSSSRRAAEEAHGEHRELMSRFQDAREQFNAHLRSREPGDGPQ